MKYKPLRHPTVFAHLHYCSVIFTRMSNSEQVAVGGLRSVDHGDLDDGFEDRTIDCPAKKGELENMYYHIMRDVKETRLRVNIPGYISSSCNNGAL